MFQAPKQPQADVIHDAGNCRYYDHCRPDQLTPFNVALSDIEQDADCKNKQHSARCHRRTGFPMVSAGHCDDAQSIDCGVRQIVDAVPNQRA